MNVEYHPDARSAALDLLNNCADLSFKEGGFLGHCATTPALTERQRMWLVKLLERKQRPPLREAQ
jgi:hypothetical protein